jgi:hypothetical protein
MAWEWLKHAFAIEPDGAFTTTEAQRTIVDKICRQIVARELTTPALVFLESVRPLNYVSAQTLQFFTPILSVVADADSCNEFALFLERRGSIEFLCARLEELERQRANPDLPPPS